jgi:hypothetical protein
VGAVAIMIIRRPDADGVADGVVLDSTIQSPPVVM